ncbi:MAG TPA: hypothetical protein VE604_07640 [Candidatus Polarisedimenticolia bacterium]|nr:hypothetical protein [Candidatus Polarisedimenticolia bacterium]
MTVLRAAMWSGAAQFLLIALGLIIQFKEHFIARSQQLAPRLEGSNETGQAIVTAMVAFEFLFHPLSLFLLYLAMEGAVRFLGGIITAETVPSLLVFLFFKISDSTSQSISRRRNGPPVADAIERLADGRIRIASATLKAGWNTSVTIGIDGQWFEVEREEQAHLPHSYAYVLRPSPPGKILRGYHEYDAAGVLKARSTTKPEPVGDVS